MLKKFKTIIVITTLAIGLGGITALPVYAAGALQGDACAGLSQVDTSQGCGTGSDTTISNDIKTAVSLLSLVVGVAAVIAIIVNGLKFVTAQGDSSSIASARTGLIYAMVGLVVAALAQFIVHFVLGKV